VSDLGFGLSFLRPQPALEPRLQFADEGLFAQRPPSPGVSMDFFGQRLIHRFAQVLWASSQPQPSVERRCASLIALHSPSGCCGTMIRWIWFGIRQ